MHDPFTLVRLLLHSCEQPIWICFEVQIRKSRSYALPHGIAMPPHNTLPPDSPLPSARIASSIPAWLALALLLLTARRA
jgi:hypothetical protein